MDARACARLASYESAAFGNESHVPSEPPSRARTGPRMAHDTLGGTHEQDLGVWTSDDCALVLIDYQPEQFESIRSETPADLARTACR